MENQRIFGTLDPFLETGPVLGRKVANAGFLRFLLAADPFDEYHFFLADQPLRQSLAAALGALAPDLERAGKFRLFDRRNLPALLAATPYHCFHQSDCIVYPPHLARLRNAYAQALFPITGPIHSLSYPNYPAAFLHHLWAGATARDCIVATSKAGQAAVENIFSHLRSAYGLQDVPGPSIRRVPLGIAPEEVAQSPTTPEQRQDLRAALGLPQDRTLLLVLGRISHASKMDVLPLYRALHRLFTSGDGQPPLPRESVAVVLAGWAEEDDPFPQTLVDIAHNMGLLTHLELRPGDRRKQGLLAACDVFVSIADNPQETFGLSILEAQAAGLPVVASDYDGYRDLVAHGVTGLLVPTAGLEPGGFASQGQDDLVDRLAPVLFDNQYHLLLAQRTAVDVPQLAQALDLLITDADQARRMGQAGIERMHGGFLWPQVVERHVELWGELWALPTPEIASLRTMPHPLHLPYARVFAPYPSRTLGPEAMLQAGRTGRAMLAGKDFPYIYAGLDAVIDPERARKTVFLARKPVSAGELETRLLELCPGLDPDLAHYQILWCLKHDLLEFPL